MPNQVSYDFKIKTIGRHEQSRIIDFYQALGYEVTNIAPAAQFKKLLDVTLKRDSNIPHKAELVQLEQKIGAELNRIAELKRTETKAPKINAYVLGTVATLTFGGGMSLALTGNSTVSFVAGIVVGIVGLVFCAVNDLIYKKFLIKKQNQNYQPIQDAYQKIENYCAEARLFFQQKEQHGRH